MLKIYLSGAITGREAEAKKEFAEAEKRLKQKLKELNIYYEVINPFKIVKNQKKYSYVYYLKADIKELIECCYLINIKNAGWQKSKGAKLERQIAKMLKIDIFNGVDNFIKFKIKQLDIALKLKKQGKIKRTKKALLKSLNS